VVKYILTSLGDINSRFTWTADFDTSSYNDVNNNMEFGTLGGTTYAHADVRAGIYCTGGENKLDVI
jgi:hypothetical protein